MNNGRMNTFYGNTDGIGDHPDKSSGSPSGSSNSSHSSPPPGSYFYDLQMYSNTNPNTNSSTNSNTNFNANPSATSPQYNLYQNVQEVPYHQGHFNSSRPPTNNFNAGSSNIHGQRQQQSSSPVGSARQVEKGGITFVDPFTTSNSNTFVDPFAPSNSNTFIDPFRPSQYSSSPSNSPQYTSNYSVPTAQKVHVSTETVLEPVYATFGIESIFVTCPYCHHTESTDIEQAIGSEAMLWACIIPFFGFLRKSKWETRHRCKNCLNVIGTYYP